MLTYRHRHHIIPESALNEYVCNERKSSLSKPQKTNKRLTVNNTVYLVNYVSRVRLKYYKIRKNHLLAYGIRCTYTHTCNGKKT